MFQYDFEGIIRGLSGPIATQRFQQLFSINSFVTLGVSINHSKAIISSWLALNENTLRNVESLCFVLNHMPCDDDYLCKLLKSTHSINSKLGGTYVSDLISDDHEKAFKLLRCLTIKNGWSEVAQAKEFHLTQREKLKMCREIVRNTDEDHEELADRFSYWLDRKISPYEWWIRYQQAVLDGHFGEMNMVAKKINYDIPQRDIESVVWNATYLLYPAAISIECNVAVRHDISSRVIWNKIIRVAMELDFETVIYAAKARSEVMFYPDKRFLTPQEKKYYMRFLVRHNQSDSLVKFCKKFRMWREIT